MARTRGVWLLALLGCHGGGTPPTRAEATAHTPAITAEASIAAPVQSTPATHDASSVAKDSAVPTAAPSTPAFPVVAHDAWCLQDGVGEFNNRVVPPLTRSGAAAARILLASSYAKDLRAGVDGKFPLLVQAYVCPNPARCRAAGSPEEEREACDYSMRIYVYDPAMSPPMRRPLFYLDESDDVDGRDGSLWRDDASSGWRKLD